MAFSEYSNNDMKNELRETFSYQSKRVINATFRNIDSGDEINRDLDISLFNVTGGITHDPEIQHQLLHDWIEQRGNAQHNCELSLISWAIVPY